MTTKTLPKPQYVQLAETLRARIQHGDYVYNDIPALRRLAAKMNVSHIVARKAVELLIRDGLLNQHSNGRLTVKGRSQPSGRDMLRIAFLAPAFDSGFTNLVRIAVEQVAAEKESLMRPIDYVHWNDLVIEEALENFDGVVLLCSSEPLPESVLEHLVKSSVRVVTVDYDLTDYGIPCISLFRASSIELLLDHLSSLGHTSVDCFNTQPVCQEIAARINAWRTGLASSGLTGNLINEPVPAYSRPVVRGYEIMGKMLDDGFPATGSIFFTNEAAAKGAMRALTERGVAIGIDISICAVGDLGEARYLIPSLTSLEMPDPVTLLRPCINWMGATSRDWSGPLLLQAPHIPVFIGESTGPAARVVSPSSH